MITLIVIWYFTGLVGAVFGTISDLSLGIDFKYVDLVVCLIVALTGPVALFLGLYAYCTLVENGKFNKTLIKGKK